MLWWVLAQILSLLLDLAANRRQPDQAKDIEILLLRHQLRILQRRLPQPTRPSRWEKLALAVLTAKLRSLTRDVHTHWRQGILLFSPDTVLRWHRELVRWKWMFRQRRSPGRPRTVPEAENLIVQLAGENPAFATVFKSEGTQIVRTPYRAANANAIAERWIRWVREECLDHLLILHERHLQCVLSEYGGFFNHRRPHQRLAGQCPVPAPAGSGYGHIHRRDVLGGIIHHYYRQAA